MKCLIKISFADKYTGALYVQGDTVDFSEERVKEILPTGFIKPLEEPKPKKTRSRKA